ncbi:MAG: IS630 family transposase [Prochloron sp. SP5CPC1]|nr:IS630 family transposase [Candidatus Paraprochloron terpiosi SP5CPC1]
MPKRVKLEPHLSTKELEAKYRRTKEGIERSHYQIIWLLSQGKTAQEVAELTGYSRVWVYELVKKYNLLGEKALGDKRKEKCGREPLLNEVQQAQLWQALQEQPADGDLWSGPKVATWMSEILARPIHPQRGWEYLRQMGMRRRRPRPEHIESDPQVQQAWKKKLSQQVKLVKKSHPEAQVEVWAEDEHRVGLQPVNRYIWVPQGEQPIAKVNLKYHWMWLTGFVEPTTGQTYWWIVPRLNWHIFERMLLDEAQYFGLGSEKRVILALERASFHTSEKITVPDGIHLLFFPPKSPELQPAERLWPLTNEAIANQAFVDLDALEEVTAHRCRVLMARPEKVRGVTAFDWWCDAVAV